jgi:hypothetical protein
MKVRIQIPMDLCLHNQGVFRISRRLTSSLGETRWQVVSITDAIAAGTYLVDLEPGQYEKVLEAANGQLIASSMFEIIHDARYIDQGGRVLTIAQDGTLLEHNDQQEKISPRHRVPRAVMRLTEKASFFLQAIRRRRTESDKSSRQI